MELQSALSALRKKALPKSFENWELLQASLFAGGLSVCPTSGTPVTDVQCCSEELKAALWGGLVAIAKAVNAKVTTEFDAAMEKLGTLVKQHAGEGEGREEESDEEESEEGGDGD